MVWLSANSLWAYLWHLSGVHLQIYFLVVIRHHRDLFADRTGAASIGEKSAWILLVEAGLGLNRLYGFVEAYLAGTGYAVVGVPSH